MGKWWRVVEHVDHSCLNSRSVSEFVVKCGVLLLSYKELCSRWSVHLLYKGGKVITGVHAQTCLTNKISEVSA